MKKTLILLVILGGLVATAIVYKRQQDAALNTAAGRGAKAREYLLPDLKEAQVDKLRIKDAAAELNLVVSGDRRSASVQERGGYPANLEKINGVLQEFREQKISGKQQIGKGAWPRNGLVAPGEGNDGVGTLVEMQGESGKTLASVLLGNSISVTGGASSTTMDTGNQRLTRLTNDGETIWVVNNNFIDVTTKPDAWLDRAFVDVQKIKEVTVMPPDAKEGWKVVRNNDEEASFSLADGAVGEALDPGKITVTTLLSAPTFTDVVTKDKVPELFKGATKVKIVTFDGFTYDIQVLKKTENGADKYFMTVSVSAQIPDARPPVKDEKEADKKKADEAFANRKKILQDKLAKEQKFAGWGYEVSEYAVNTLFKKRSEIVQVSAKAEPPVAPAPAPAAAPSPSEPVTAPSPVAPPPTAPANPAPAPETQAAPAQAPSAPAAPATPGN